LQTYPYGASLQQTMNYSQYVYGTLIKFDGRLQSLQEAEEDACIYPYTTAK